MFLMEKKIYSLYGGALNQTGQSEIQTIDLQPLVEPEVYFIRSKPRPRGAKRREEGPLEPGYRLSAGSAQASKNARIEMWD